MKTATKVIKFNLARWEREIHKYLNGMEFLGTKNTNPYVRWADRHNGPLKLCPVCRGAYTSLGLTKHINSCDSKKSRKRK